MTFHEVLSQVEARGIKLHADGDALVFRAPKGALTAELRAALTAHKAELLGFLSGRTASLAPIPRAAVDELAPHAPSAAQARLWFLERLAPGSARYHLHLGVRMRGDLDVAALADSLTALVARHAMLRAAFPERDGQPLLVVSPPADWPLPLVDLGSAADPEAELERRMAEHGAALFDLERGPLLRTTLFRLGAREHVLALTEHHIISDATSAVVMRRDLFRLYQARVTGAPHGLGAILRYVDYIEWQEAELAGDGAAALADWWRQRLAGLGRLELPSASAPRVRHADAGDSYSFTVPAHLTAALRQLGRAHGCTPYVVHLAPWVALLARYSQQDDLAIGTPTAGRDRAELADVVGFFVNMVTLRCDLAGDPPVTALLGRLGDTVAAALEHQALPFERVVAAAGVARGDENPLFSVSFALDTMVAPRVVLAGLEWEPMLERADAAIRRSTKFDLGLALTETGDSLLATIEYATDLFDREQIERMAGHYLTLAEAMTASPSARVSELALLTTAERDEWAAWNPTGRTYAAERSLHGQFEVEAERRPEAEAVACEETRLSYGELNRRANQLARHLRGLGVTTGTRVALFLERSVEMVVAMVATLKAGGTYVPLEPSNPPERLAFMLEDAAAPVLLTQGRLVEKVAAYGGVIVRLDEQWDEVARHEAGNLVGVETRPDDCAYVIYTSGSTGKAKGVQVSHGNVARLFTATEEWFHFGEGDVWTMFHSYAFDFSVWEMWGALLYGGRLVVVPYEVSRTPTAVHELLRRERVTVLNQTPSAFRSLVAADAEAMASGASADELALRLVVFGGEAVDLPSLRPWFERHGDAKPRLVNMYGITETTVHVTYRELSIADLDGSPSPIGVPIPDLQVYVLDEHQQLVPRGVAGEMYVGGAGVALGYLNRPELNAARFIGDPFTPGGRLYRTGDLGRRLADGGLEYLGRIDHQVKIRGFRIELGEIESLLGQHPAVAEVVVVARDGDDGKRLIAYVVPRTQGLLGLGELRGYLKTKLPEYMVPAAFVQLDALPLTRNGKVDRKALPEPERARPQLERAYTAPRSEAERTLCRVWAEVLKLERVGIDDRFFELGGDSILSLKVIARAKAAGLDLSLRALFRHQTIRELAASLDEAAAAASASGGIVAAAEPIADARFALLSAAERQRLPDDLDDAYPLAALQTGMVFHSLGAPGSPMYHHISSLHVELDLDAAAMRRALDGLAAAHPMLRTSFDFDRGHQPLQVVHRAVTIPLAVDDWRDLDDAAQEAALDACLEADKRRGFDFARAPLLRFYLHRRRERTWQVTLVAHHAIFDGWSVAVLWTELLQRLGGMTAPSPPRSHYRRLVALEQEALASTTTRDFWRQRLDGMTLSPLPAGYAATPASAQRVVEIALGSELVRGLERVAHAAGAPLKSVLLAAHLGVMSAVAGQPEVVTGLVANGRPEEEEDADRALGLYLNTLPFRQRVAGHTWLELVRAAFAAEQELLPHRRYPLAELQRQHQGPLFDSFFNYVHFHVYEQLGEQGLGRILGWRGFEQTNFKLVANFGRGFGDGELGLQLVVSMPELGDEAVHELGGYYRRALEQLARDAGALVHDVEVLAPERRRQIVEEWNDNAVGYAREASLHGLVAEQAGKTPAATAVEHEGARLSYAELEARANQVARRLRGLGVGVEDRVAVCLPRTPELVVGLLGVLKAGACYVPLDPEYPAGRLEHMLADSGAAVLITEAVLAAALPPTGARLFLVDEDEERARLAAESAEAISIETGPENLAYCIYTSGSTGRPKGVALQHGNAVAFLQWAAGAFTREDTARVLFSTSVCFDLSIYELFLPLTTGGTVVLVKNALRLLEPGFTGAPTLVNTVPSAAQALLDAGAVSSSVRVVNLAGEPLRRELATGLQTALPQIRLFNLYGPTEYTTYSTYYEIKDEARITIGRPLANTQVYILNERYRPAPIGVAGEIYIAGAGLARGYWQRAGLTAERFVPNPFGPPGSRMYRTGDLGRFQPDGSVDFLGRIDHQVKVRGFRIELGEIESVLGQHPAIAEAVVIARDSTGGQQLVAYVAPATGESTAGAAATARELQAYLKGRLPDYMVPAAFVELAALPLTPNGKVDRKALPAPEAPEADERPLLTPRTPVEEAVAGLWAEVLRRDRVGLGEDFFALGGHSLVATQVMSRLRALFGVELPLRTLFEAPTVEALSSRVQEALAAGATATLPPLERMARPAELPLSFGQQRLWFLDQLQPNSAAYNMPVAAVLRGRLDVAALERSLGEIVRRHEALRTRFPARDGRPYQEIVADATLELVVTRPPGATVDERRAEARHQLQAESEQPFDLLRGPLVRSRLWAIDEDEHLFALLLHHAVADGWSLGVMIRELGTLYPLYSRGKQSTLPELGVQYADYTLWQRRWLNDERLAGELAYWTQQLAGAPPLDLATDRPRPPVQSERGGAVPLALSPELTAALHELSRRHGVTLFMTLLAVWQLLLQRYSGQDDIVVGTPVAGRSDEKTEALIGLFINTLALRTDLGGAPTGSEVLARVREATLAAYAHQSLPFESLLAQLAPERDASRPPLFQVMFVLQNAHVPPGQLGDVALDPLVPEPSAAKLELTLSLGESERGLAGTLEYNRDLFDRETVARMAAHFAVLAASLAAAPSRRASELALLTTAERDEWVAWNPTGRTYAAERSLHGQFEVEAERRPEAEAVACEETRLSYGELNRRANQLARHLRGLGVTTGTRVALFLERSVEMVVAMVATLKAGGTYVPLEPSNPPERLAFMLEDAAAPVLLTQGRLVEKVAAYTGVIVRLDEQWDEVARHEEGNLVGVETRPDDCAYVIYTSGSTGKAKGVQVSHGNVARLFTATEEWFHFGEGDVWTMFHSYAFDFSVWEMWGALLYGGRLVVVPYEVSRTPTAFHELLRRERVTVLNQTPSAFRSLVAADGEAAAETDEELALRLVVFGGEAVDLPSLRPWFERHGDAKPCLVNMYGITETTVHVTYRELSIADLDGSPSPIGVPIPDLQVYVLDEHQQLVPRGVAGEMYVGGAGVALGYLNRPELNAARFIGDPFTPGGRLYRTGDLGRRLADGGLEYLGRIDHQVKIRGFRIELGEIESLLGQHPAVAEVVVVARDDGGGKRLVAYVVARAGDLAIGELRGYLKTKLPEYMVPAAFVQLDALPLTRNGKVDRKALPAPERVRPQLERAYTAPSSDAERILCRVWAEVLKLERVGIDDRFFELGGDSILSLKVIARAKAAGLDLSLRALFRYQTVRELAASLTAPDAAPDIVSAPAPIDDDAPFAQIGAADRRRLPDDVEDAYPLATLQIGMVFHSQSALGASMYHDITSFHVELDTDAERVRAALDRLAAAHPIVRTSFDFTRYSQPLQLVHRQVAVPLTVDDLRGRDHAAQEAALDACLEEDKRRGFDFANAPLLRFYLHRRSERTWQVTLVNHHAILDGWSVAALCTEVMQHLVGVATPPPPRSHYRRLVALEREALTAPETREYWRERLDGMALSPLPQGYAATPAPARRLVDVPLEPALVLALRQLGHDAGTPLKSVLLAAHLGVMSAVAGQPEVVTGLVANGRPEEEDAERALGLYLNTVPFRQRVTGYTWLELVRATFAAEQELLPHRRYPLAELQRQHQGTLFDSFFNYVHFHVFKQVGEQGLGRIIDGRGFELTNFKLVAAFNRGLGEDELTLQLSVSLPDLSDEAAHELGGYYRRALEQLARDAAAPVAETALLAPERRRQIVEEWNDNTVGYAREASLHGLVAAQAGKTPAATAVEHEGARLSYAELEARANQVARRLRGLGVGVEDRVAVCLPRTPELVVGLLGVLKAGACYVPLDPEYPAGRLEHMLADSGAAVLITEAALAAALPPTGARLFLVDEDEERARLAAESAEAISIETGPENLAYCIYTSGSTGRPKGVALQHGNAVAFLHWAAGAFDRADIARVLFSTSVCFDLSIYELFLPLTTGGTVVLVKNALRLLEPGFTGAPTLVNTVPSAAQALLDAGAVSSSVRVVNLAGEPLRRELATGLQTALPQIRLFNLYGPTEYTTYSTYCEIKDEARITIGRPLANTQVYILNERYRPAPIGVAGEIYIAGAGLARGYWQRAGLTAERFVPNPFGPPGSRMYRTGDLGRFQPDGSIDFLGRIDHQVKVRGFRIELGEIESVLGQHPAVAEAVVIARDSTGGQQLVAYVAPATGESTAGAAAAARELQAHLKGRLPDYMVPAAFVELAALPLMPNGKVDRKALPAPEALEAEERTLVAPRTPIEEAVANLWAEVLRRERVGLGEDFFALGGHSLVATQVMSRLRALFGVELPLRTLFESPTVEALASRVQEALAAGKAATLPPLARMERPAELPLSFGQQRLWFLDQLQPNSAAYNVPVATRLRGRLDVAALERSLAEIVRRHEVLRTRFPARDGRPYQEIDADAANGLTVTRLEAATVAERRAEARQQVQAEAARPFDLARGPLIRMHLWVVDEREHVLLLALHHAVADGWSLGVILHELGALYPLYTHGKQSALPELSVQYADYALWQRGWLSGGRLEAELAYWKRQLAGVTPALELPTDRPRPVLQSDRGATVALTLPAALARDLNALGRQEGATLFMVLLAGWQLLLHRYSGQDDVVVGAPIAGRSDEKTELLIGFFVNTLALRSDLGGNPTVRELLARVREVTLGAYAHQTVPLEKLLEHVVRDRPLSRPPLFQVMFALQNAPMPELRLGDVLLTLLPPPQSTAKLELTLSLREVEHGLEGELEYNRDLFDRATVERMVEQLAVLLTAMAATPEGRVDELSLLPEAERRRLLVSWNDSAARFAAVGTLGERVAAQVARTPNAPAVVHGAEVLSYAALNARANRLAHRLRRLGVGPSARVALLAERSADAVVGLLGIVKAGGAYVPLDASHPRDRLGFILGDTEARVVVAQSHLAARLPEHGAAVVLLDDDATADEPDGEPPPAAGLDDVAYVIYTSGSTGQPKGVLLEQRGLLNLVDWHVRSYGLGPAARTTQVASLGFDAATWEIWPTLIAGATLYVVADEVRLAPAVLVTWLLEQEITSTFLPTPLAEAVLEQPWPATAALRTLLTGGDWLHRRPPPGLPFRVINHYGPTEITVVATAATVEPEGAAMGEPSIGTPIANTRVYVLDGAQQPVPIGVAGELYVGGVGVARGYLNRPELSAERFVADPFVPGGRLYRTGDRCRWRSDGRLEYLGRGDQQVKLRGYRIELGEIESALGQHPAVAECAVVARDDEAGDKRLVAYVVAREPSRPSTAPAAPRHLDIAELQQHLRAKLPDYMVPALFMQLPALPLAASGKVDRAALPAVTAAPAATVAPRTPLEQSIAAVWAEVLRRPEVGRDDDFFAVGGHSLSAVTLLKRLEERLGQAVSLARFFQRPTVAGLAAELRGQHAARPWSPLVALQPDGDGLPFFCVHPGIGSVARYDALARHLGGERPFYALVAIGLERGQTPDTRVEDMAARYLEAVRTVQPRGPYLLGGHSFGGLVAFEMARQLERAGERVDLVALLDTTAPGPLWQVDEPGRDGHLVLSLLREADVAVDADELLRLDPEAQVQRCLDLLVAAGQIPANYGAEQMRRLVTWRTRVVPAAYRAYVPAVYDGALTLLRAEAGIDPGVIDLFNGWHALATRPLTVHAVPGDHFSMLRPPHLVALAERLRACLDAAEARAQAVRIVDGG